MPIAWPIPRPNTALEIAKQIKNLTAFSSLFDFKGNKVSIDSLVFKLHSVITVLILLVGTIFISMRQYFGDPIECMTTRQDIPQATLQHYCWLESTWSVSGTSSNIAQGIHGIQVAYPGVRMLDPTKGERRVQHKYYQWVYFILIIQAIMFYVPRFLWKAREDKRLGQLISDLRLAHISEFRDYDRNRLLQDVVDTLLISNSYYSFFIGCETMCLLHLGAQFWFTNMFLSGSFKYLGFEWLSYANGEEDNTADPLIQVFPRLTKCTFHKFGMSGTIEPIDALCFLPLNIVNEKLFVVLWFWYVFMFAAVLGLLSYHMVLFLVPFLRFRVLRTLAPSTSKKYLKALTRRPGNFFVLSYMADHMKPSHFRDLIDLTMSKHFDQNGKPLGINSGKSNQPNLTKAVANGLQGVAEAAQAAAQNGGGAGGKAAKESKSGLKDHFKANQGHHKESSSKSNKLDAIQIPAAPAPGFVNYDTRNEPSGSSGDDWQEEDWNSSSTNSPVNPMDYIAQLVAGSVQCGDPVNWPQ